MWKRFRRMLATPIDGGSLAVFRMVMGTVLAGEAYRLFVPRGNGNWIEGFYTGSHLNWLFPYHGFEWVRPWPEPWMTWHVYVLFAAGVCVAVGLAYRLAAIAAFLTWTFIFLLDETHYNNHYYLYSLLTLLLIWMPAARRYSVDAQVRRLLRRGAAGPTTVPFWTVMLIRGQLIIVYFYGGVTKISQQWLIHAEPLRSQLREPHVVEAVQRLTGSLGVPHWVELLTSSKSAVILSYGGLAFDLAVGPLLLMRRTRLLAIALAVLFHGLNHSLLFDDIGTFPWMGAGTLLIFLEPDWPGRLFRWLRHPGFARPNLAWLIGGAVLVPGIGALLGWKSQRAEPPAETTVALVSRWTALLVVVWLTVQATLPLRHLLIEGNVNWTSEGERFSWRMKAGRKQLAPLVIRVEDDRLVRNTPHGPPAIDWQQWQGPRVIYRQVDPQRIDWTRMPEIAVVFQPLYGERIVYNPWAGRPSEGESYEQASTRAKRRWEAVYGRSVRTYPTADLPVVLAAAEQQLAARSARPELIDAVQAARVIASQLAALSPGADDAHHFVSRLHSLLLAVAKDPEHSAWFRTLLARAHPLATEGAPSTGARFVALEDPDVYVQARGNFLMLDREKWQLGWPQADVVFADVGRFTSWELYPLPRVILWQLADTHVEILWNQHADLTEMQERIMKGRPFMCHQYAGRIAAWWEQVYGRRPKVFFSVFGSLPPYPLQPMIDPKVDLAAVPLRHFRRNDWIIQHAVAADYADQPAQHLPKESASAASRTVRGGAADR